MSHNWNEKVDGIWKADTRIPMKGFLSKTEEKISQKILTQL